MGRKEGSRARKEILPDSAPEEAAGRRARSILGPLLQFQELVRAYPSQGAPLPDGKGGNPAYPALRSTPGFGPVGGLDPGHPEGRQEWGWAEGPSQAAGSGSYRSAEWGWKKEGETACAKGEPALPQEKERRGAGSRRGRQQGRSPHPAVAPSQGCRAERAAAPPPARPRPEAAQPRAPGTPTPRPKAPSGGRAGRGGRSSDKAPAAAVASGEKLQTGPKPRGRGAGGAKSPRKVSTRPGVGRAHPSARQPQTRPRAAALVYFRGYKSSAREEQRGRSATRGGSCDSRGPSAFPHGAPRRSPLAAPGPCTQQALSRAGAELAGLRRKKAGA